LVDALTVSGQHVAIFGEAGVGKTSLGKFVSATLGERAVYTACGKDSSLSSLFESAFAKISVARVEPGMGFRGSQSIAKVPLSGLMPRPPWGQEQVLLGLANLERADQHVLFFDEFDRLRPEVKASFAEILKAVSDQGGTAALVIIGVAHDIEGLVTEHSSVDRCLRQIHMPRMSSAEIEGVLTRGLEKLGMTATTTARAHLVELSRGLPFFAHTLGLASARSAIARGEDVVRLPDMRDAALATVADKQSTQGAAYRKATGNSNPEVFRRVLLAAAACKKDIHGTFSLMSVREEFSTRGGDPKVLVNTMNGLAKAAHGSVLHSYGNRHTKAYRFKNPLLEAFIGLVEATQAYRMDPPSPPGSHHDVWPGNAS